MSAADWKPYDVPGLAGLLARQPTDTGTHSMAWQQAYETLTAQRQGLEAARAALIEAWPATPGSAAGSFFDQVDALTQAMGASAEDAVNAHGALTGIVSAIDGATAKVDVLHQSWQQNRATIGDVVPTDDWALPLNDQAHTVMGQADAAIAEHATQLVPPVPYKPFIATRPLVVIRNGQGGGTSTGSASYGSSSQAIGEPTLSSAPSHNKGSGMTMASTPRATTSSVLVTGSQSDGGLFFEPSSRTPSDLLSKGPENSTIDLAAQSSGDVTDEPRRLSLGLQPNEPNGASGISPIEQRGAASTSAQFPRAIGVDAETVGPRSSTLTDGMTPTVGPRNPLRSGADPRMSLDARVGPDGQTTTPTEPNQPTRSTVGDGTELAPYGAMLGGGSPRPSDISNRKRHDFEVAHWAMPIGGRAIIEPRPESAIGHDPGPGVIGIDR